MKYCTKANNNSGLKPKTGPSAPEHRRPSISITRSMDASSRKTSTQMIKKTKPVRRLQSWPGMHHSHGRSHWMDNKCYARCILHRWLPLATAMTALCLHPLRAISGRLERPLSDEFSLGRELQRLAHFRRSGSLQIPGLPTCRPLRWLLLLLLSASSLFSSSLTSGLLDLNAFASLRRSCCFNFLDTLVCCYFVLFSPSFLRCSQGAAACIVSHRDILTVSPLRLPLPDIFLELSTDCARRFSIVSG